MAVTKATYTAAATWTASGLADIFKTAFIDAGLMTDWYDSFLNTVENRILEVQYDNTKTYGKTYYWFMFTTGGVFLHVASGWNATTHVPTGTQYVDYYSTTTNSTANHVTLLSLTSTTSATLTRYTSGVTSSFSWFLLRNGTSNINFHIASGGSGRPAWMDLNKMLFHPIVRSACTTSNAYGYIDFSSISAVVRRSYVAQGSLRGATGNSDFGSTGISVSSHRYNAFGNNNGSPTVNKTGVNIGIVVPIGFNNTNPAYATDVVPVFTGVDYFAYVTDSMPSDFGISFHYANNTMSLQDKLIVTSGSEEWEMIDVRNTTFSGGLSVSPMLVARVV